MNIKLNNAIVKEAFKDFFRPVYRLRPVTAPKLVTITIKKAVK